MKYFIIIVSISAYALSLHAQDFATPDGQNAIEHRTRFYSGAPIKKFSEKITSFQLENKHFSSTPAIFEDKAYIGTDSGSIYQATPDGIKEICKLENGGAIEGMPAITKTYIFAGFKNNLFAAFSRSDGKLVWKYETKGPATTSPIVHGEYVFFTTSNGLVYALNAETGAFKWKFSVLSSASSPAFEKDIEFGKDAVIVGNDRQHFYAINAKNGDKIWEFTGAGGLPLINESDIYGISLTGTVRSLDKTTARGVWHFVDDLTAGTTELACANHTLIFSNYRRLMALDSRAGEGFKWQKNFPRSVGASIIAGDVVYIVSDDGNLYAEGLETGSEYSHIAVGVSERWLPAFCNGKIIYVSAEKILFIGGE